MSWASAQIAGVRSDLRAYIDRSISRIFGFTRSSASSSLGDSDNVEIADAPEPGEKLAQRPGRRTEPWGHRGRPPKGIRSLTLRLGSSSVFIVGYASNGEYGPADLDIGETALYCAADGTIVKLDKNGKIAITPKSGQAVELGGNTYSGLKLENFLADLNTFLTGLTTANLATKASTFQALVAAGTTYKSTTVKLV